jgi:phage terminase large subunit GpA-like protein
MLIVLPSQDTAKEWSKQRLTQLLNDTPSLQGKVLDSRRERGNNTIGSKSYPGGIIKVAWASSAKKLRSMPSGLILADEVDGFQGDVQGEGDPVALLKRRFSNFPRGKLLMISSPTLKHLSRIEREFTAGDQRYYFVSCPHCGHRQALVFTQLQWEKGKPETAIYYCVSCGRGIPERFKTEMLAGGVWVATKSQPGLVMTGFPAGEVIALPETSNPSFHLSALYSPLGWYSWRQCAADWEAAQGRPDLLKVFLNTVLGQTWADKGELLEPERLFAKREFFELATVPNGGLFLTASADVMRDRLEIAIDAWGRNRERWGIWYEIITGDTSLEAPWRALRELLMRWWPHESGGQMLIWVMGIDTGYRPEKVYEFAHQHGVHPAYGPAGARVIHNQTVVPIKGGHSLTKSIENISTIDAAKKRGGLRIITLGTPCLKGELLSLLRLPRPAPGEPFPSGFCHFAYPEYSYYQSLCSEQRIVRQNGAIEWMRDPSIKNEAWDLEVYNFAMAILCGLNSMREVHLAELERRIKPSTPPPTLTVSPANTPTPSKPSPTPPPAPNPVRLEFEQAVAGRQARPGRPIRGRFI